MLFPARSLTLATLKKKRALRKQHRDEEHSYKSEEVSTEEPKKEAESLKEAE